MTNKMKLGLWSNRIFIFLNSVLILGVVLGFISKDLMKEMLPFILSLNFIYVIFPAYSLYKSCYGNNNINIEGYIKKAENKTTKENDYDK
ncbi:hypothetical protein ACE2A4_004577 [Salmonella enterica]|nr:hypothetical protein [Salmonella enterica]EDZ9085790.1 hypothetical protein [Salmonella enterica subsp. enterica serovar Newport]EIB5534843.1 hypothetical protein [Salmonella enterica subsp. enterica serovar Infantis]EIX0472855.1 hypothetical protein [Salmonella enterica subsp. enterica serovar Anatum]HBB7822424.1 hypothetical protein [Escherichia coli]